MPDISIWNKCNNNCVMCTNSPNFQNEIDSDLLRFEKIIQNIKSLGKIEETINLSGGEPTIHPDFLRLLKWFRRQFSQTKIVVATNGRMFCYPKFARECFFINDVIFEIAIHGYNARMHDNITRVKGSFNQTIAGIHNVLKYKNDSHQLEIRIILIRQNYKYLDKILNLIINKFPSVDRVVLLFQEMEGVCGENFKTVGITYKKIRKYLPPLFKRWEKKFKELRLYHFPLCTIDFNLWKYHWRTLRKDEVTFLPSCNECLYKKYCLGIHKDYLKLVGGEEFIPIRKKIPIKTEDNFYHPIVEIKDFNRNR